MDNLLFDRFVNLTLTDANGVESKIVTPKTGRKPNIQISGSAIQSNVLPSVSVRVVNFYSSTAIADLTKIAIEAGYYSSAMGRTTLRGNLNNMGVGWVYQESPSPDGITNFNFMVGDYGSWTSANCTVSHPDGAGLTVEALLKEAVSGLGLNVVAGPRVKNLIWSAKVEASGSVKDFVTMLADTKGFIVQVWGSDLLAYYQNEGHSVDRVPKEITYLSSPPQKQTPVTISFVAPWRPDIRCGDLIKINPQYAKQSYGGSLGSSDSDTTYVVTTMEFDFSTVDSTNTMRILAIKNGATVS